MVALYNIAGRQIGSHWLAIATLATIGGLSFAATPKSAAKKSEGPPTNAQSPDEEKFIQDFLKNADAGGQKGGIADAAKQAAKQ